MRIIDGGIHSDARGMMRFCNDFDMTQVKRFYTISNSAEHPKRGWIMHKRETKWFFPLRGNTILHVEQDKSYVLSSNEPKVLYVPPGNWFMIEQDGDAEVQVFSSCRLGEFQNDDFRK